MITNKFNNFFSGIVSNSSNNKIGSFVFSVDYIPFQGLIRNIQKSNQNYFYLTQPSIVRQIIGFESLLSISFSGADRIGLSEKEINELSKNFISNWNEHKDSDFPLFLGGLKFRPEGNTELTTWSDYKDSEWFIPTFTFYQNGTDYYLIYNFFINADLGSHLSKLNKFTSLLESALEDGKEQYSSSKSFLSEQIGNNDFTPWEEKVKGALKIISDGDAEKIVLSRQVEYNLNKLPNIEQVLEELSTTYPTCHTFAFRKGKSIFFGASPERLAKISEGWIEADALAGSAPRGKTEEEDKLIVETQLKSNKNINEQKAVVDFIANSFKSFSDEINFDKNPQIKKLPNIQHLWTPIRAKLLKTGSVFSLLKEIHPTPAICGVPWSKALTFINNTENHKRGLYAGIIGWFNFYNEGEFIVALRSGLLKDRKLYAFAGCGIVEGSDPLLEYKESELKLQPILSLFKDEKEAK